MERFQLPEGARRIIALLEQGGYDAYAVGGCVRDSLLGLAPKDWDLCTSARPEEMKALFAAVGIKTIDTGLRHGTVTANLRSAGLYEVTTFRVDGAYSDGRHPDRVAFVGRVEEDLARRDFTVNAMAYAPRRGLVDPFGGQRALRARVLACVGEPGRRFSEDALRVMRALRFAAVYGFSIAPATAAALRNCAPELKGIAAERVREELFKLLAGREALPVLLGYSDVITAVLPELAPCVGFSQHSPFHPYSLYEHMVRAACAYGGTDPAVRLALFLHDIGKPRCFTRDGAGVGHFYGHAALGRDMAAGITARLRLDNKTRGAVLDLIAWHDSPIEPTARALRRWLGRLGEAGLGQLFAVQRGDILAQSRLERAGRLKRLERAQQVLEEVLAAEECFSMKDLKLTGREVMALGVPPGPKVGKVLKVLLDEVIAGELENAAPALSARAEALIKAL